MLLCWDRCIAVLVQAPRWRTVLWTSSDTIFSLQYSRTACGTGCSSRPVPTISRSGVITVC